MITVLRRWFVPSSKLEDFAHKWQTRVLPELRRQPGCMRVEVYESSIRDHWVTAISWKDHDSRLNAMVELADILTEFAPYQRFEPEILTLRGGDADEPSSSS
jgi:hypothetical protein